MQSIVYLSLSMSCSWFKIRLCSRDARLCLPGHSSFNQSWIRPCQHRKFISGSPLWSSIMVTCDFQELSDSKLCTSSGTFPEISSRAMAGLSSGNNFVFHGVQSSNAASWHTFPGGEKARECFSSRGQCCGTSPAYSVNVCCSNMQSASKMALERCSSKSATPLMSGCPRVFCMGKSGYLLLSNTGLLGIVCSCHCCHMSVLKFCEHSGLHGVNPGDAVRMESGETIAQWQKLYFLKFGQREH